MGAEDILRTAARGLTLLTRAQRHFLLLVIVLTSMFRPAVGYSQSLPDSGNARPESRVLLAEGTLLTLPPPEVRRWQVGLLRADRLQHCSTSFAIAAGTGIVTEDRVSALAISLGVGFLKECWDARHGRFDPVDLAADATGALLGSLTARIH